MARAETIKRGCKYCTDAVRTNGKRKRIACIHEACPYTVLDKYDTYKEFIKSKDSELNVAGLFCHGSGAGRVTLSAKGCRPLQKTVGKRYF